MCRLEINKKKTSTNKTQGGDGRVNYITHKALRVQVEVKKDGGSQAERSWRGRDAVRPSVKGVVLLAGGGESEDGRRLQGTGWVRRGRGLFSSPSAVRRRRRKHEHGRQEVEEWQWPCDQVWANQLWASRTRSQSHMTHRDSVIGQFSLTANQTVRRVIN